MHHLGGGTTPPPTLGRPSYTTPVLGGVLALGPAKGPRGQPRCGRHNSPPAVHGVLLAHRRHTRRLRVPCARARAEDGDSMWEEDPQAGPGTESPILSSFGRTRVPM